MAEWDVQQERDGLWQDRKDWLRVARVKTDLGWAICLVLDGYYSDEEMAEEQEQYSAERYGIQRGLPRGDAR
jgi:hypothetical protein